MNIIDKILYCYWHCYFIKYMCSCKNCITKSYCTSLVPWWCLWYVIWYVTKTNQHFNWLIYLSDRSKLHCPSAKLPYNYLTYDLDSYHMLELTGSVLCGVYSKINSQWPLPTYHKHMFWTWKLWYILSRGHFILSLFLHGFDLNNYHRNQYPIQ